MRIHLIAAAVLAMSLAGCGSSSAPAGGDGGGGGNPAPGRGTAQVLGTRGVPGGTITVSCDGALQPGTSAVFHLTLGAGMPAPSSVQAWIGAAYDPAAIGIAATPVVATPGTWDAAVTIPSPVTAGSHVWVRLTFADGSVVETGGEDFMLAAL